jgi:hypothetical protein
MDPLARLLSVPARSVSRVTSLIQTYAYMHASATGGSLALETSGGATPADEAAHPAFFDGAGCRIRTRRPWPRPWV